MDDFTADMESVGVDWAGNGASSSGSDFGGWFSQAGSVLKDAASSYMGYKQFDANMEAQSAAIDLQRTQTNNAAAIQRMQAQQQLRAAQQVYGGSGGGMSIPGVGQVSSSMLMVVVGAVVLVVLATRKG